MKRHLQTVLAGVGMLALATMPTFGATHVSPRAAQSPVTAYADAEKGTQNNPYYVEDLLAMDLPDTEQPVEDVWLEGYIVGWVKGMFYSSGVQFELDPAGETVNSNIILGPSEDVTDPDLCVPVQLPKGAVRNELNLNSNPGNLGKYVKIHGQYAQYFGRRGFKQADEYEWVETEIPDDPSAQMYVIGNNVNGAVWELASPDAKMTMTAPGVWEWSGMVLGSEFKFNDGTWSGDYNIGSASVEEAVSLDVPYTVVNSGDAMNIAFGEGILEINKPRIVLDLNTMQVTVSGTTKVAEEYFLVGDFNDWVIGLNTSRFELQTDGSYKLANFTIAGDGEVKGGMLISTMGYAEKYGVAAGADVLKAGREVALELNGENIQYSVPAGKYDVVFRDGDAPTVKFVPIFAADKGALENPYTVDEFYMLDVDNTINNVWLNAYIVGWVEGAAYDSGVHFELGADDSTTQTNILVAAAPDVTDAEACIPVQLPSGAIRTGLNLKDNPDNLGKQVLLRGDYTKYFARRGLKNTSKFQIVTEIGEPVALTVQIADGPAMKSLARDKEEMVLNVAFADEYWEVTEASVNGEKLFDTPAADAEIKFTVNGDTQVEVLVGYKGELQFVETSGVVELTDSIKVGVADGKVYVEGLAEGDEVVVYSMAGMIIGRHKATESRLEIKLDKGAYVVRVGEKAAKVAL